MHFRLTTDLKATAAGVPGDSKAFVDLTLRLS